MNLTREMREFIEATPFAALCIPFDLGAGEEVLLVVKGARDVMEGLRGAGRTPDIGWLVHTTQWGPVVCMAVRAEAEGVGDLLAEVLFDPSDAADMALLETLSRQACLRCVCLGDETKVIWTPEISWGELEQLQVDQARDRGDELAERCAQLDFDRARESYQAEVGLERLVRQVFPE